MLFHRGASFAATVLLAVVPVIAHDLYLMPDNFVVQPGSQVKVVFQNGDEFPVASSPVKPERLRDTRLVSKNGAAEFRNITAEATRTVADVEAPGTGVAILTARTIPNLIELEPAKFEEYLTHENLTATLEWRKKHNESDKPGRERYSKYAKSLIRAGEADEFYRHRTGLTIEIIPEANPYKLRPGGTLPVQLLFRGAPAVDVAVESAWLENGEAKLLTVGRTDKSGRITIPVKASGPHRLHAIVMTRCHEPVADWESFWASLTFEIAAR
jgi:uncharacterized GH25 family protein